jgi:hypothetical protein
MKTRDKIRTIPAREPVYQRLQEYLSGEPLAPKITDAVTAAINEWLDRQEDGDGHVS